MCTVQRLVAVHKSDQSFQISPWITPLICVKFHFELVNTALISTSWVDMANGTCGLNYESLSDKDENEEGKTILL